MISDVLIDIQSQAHHDATVTGGEHGFYPHSGYDEALLAAMKAYNAAKDLFDNRLGWSEGRNPYAPRDLWADLGAALYGEDDERVKELRPPNPEVTYKTGDWIAYREHGIACLVVYVKCGVPYVFDPRGPDAVPTPMDYKPTRYATKEEIDKAVK